MFETSANLTETRLKDGNLLAEIDGLDSRLKEKYDSVLSIDTALNRKIVSFQANKTIPFYRWYKYKEGFSVSLLNHYFSKFDIKPGEVVLDPFAGSGTSLFAASDLGIDSIGIELLPIGQELIKARNLLQNNFSDAEFNRLLFWKENKPWIDAKSGDAFIILKITNGAYTEESAVLIKQYLSCMKNENASVQKILLFTLCCILENISFTRKDGQYLRWDQRSGRCWGAIPFDKGEIKNFNDAITEKLGEIIADSKGVTGSLFDFSESKTKRGKITLIEGSCLNELQKLQDAAIDVIITSPPYCNRYDYTRTYALELAMLGVDEKKLLSLRQEMVSCTVENREKKLLEINSSWAIPLEAVEKQELLQKILLFLNHKKQEKTLNNNGIPRMVKGYFYEMACVIFEFSRVLKKDARVVMVNDNVRYASASISVDLILSDIAARFGFEVESISVLPIAKGNSSQQMSEHGRDALRKCVYTWRKNDNLY
ncbi:DNA methyltransferase [Treponema endosymbiont of Eucomonympha sp.]|uniref:DNA methyltransferase n=1 Tax=Treponema endosymbiont of Eucomonympha sp. TaxID=1580831 RepID=UPI000750BA4C|nr:DNA methyltransferase [Treponema endosymbiont of Eucomonympha sp.]